MTIFRLLGKSRTLQTIAAVTVLSTILILRGVEAGLNSSEWASWVQAFGAIAAILASGAIATLQSRRQYNDAAKLQRDAQHAADIRISEAVLSLANLSSQYVLRTIRELTEDLATFTKIAAGKKHFDRSRILHIQADLEAIPLQSLPTSAMVESVIRIRANTRQIASAIDMALAQQGAVGVGSFASFGEALTNSHMGICLALISVESEVILVKSRD